MGPTQDIPAPDVYTNSGDRWRGYSTRTASSRGTRSRESSPESPISLGGSLGRDTATGRGAAFCTREAAKVAEGPPEGRDVSRSKGSATQARTTRVILEEMGGARLIAASDSQGGIFNRKGLDARKVLAHKEKGGSVVGYPGSEIR